MRRKDFQRLTMLSIAALASGLVGCSLLQEQPSPKLSAEVTAGPGPGAAPAGKYIVEIRPEESKPQAIEREITEQLHVQAALEQAGVARKWARMEIEMYRLLPSGGWHKMAIDFDRETHRVPPEFDYAVLPGDRIIVTQDSTNIVDDFVNRALAPIGIVPPIEKRKRETSQKYQVRG